jgi:hypothetical protein
MSRADIIRIVSWYNKRHGRFKEMDKQEVKELFNESFLHNKELGDINLKEFILLSERIVKPWIKPKPEKVMKKRKVNEVKSIEPQNINSGWKAYLKESREKSKNISNEMLEGYQRVSHRYHFQSDEHFIVDHKYSIFYGFKHGVPLEEIVDRSNLRVISARKNSHKGIRIFIDEHNEHLKKYLPEGFKKYHVTS